MKPFLLPVCLLLTVGVDATAQKQSLEVISLQHLCTSHQAEHAPAWYTMMRRPPSNQSDCYQDLLQATEAYQPFSPDAVMQMLYTLHSAAMDANHLHLETAGPSLIALGEAAEVANVKAEVELAREVMCRPLQIEFAAWDATDRETPAGVLSAADFQRFTTNRTQLWRCVSTTQPGVPITLARERWTRYVHDINVEVAQKQTITSPVTDSYCEGGHALVRPLALLGDEFVLQVQFITGQKRGVVRTLQTGMAGAADIDLPTLETCYGACSARVPNGGALAATMRGHATGGGQLVLTFRITSSQPPQTGSPKGLGIFPCGALTADGLNQRLPPPPALCSEGPRDGEDDSEPFGRLDQEQLLQLLRAAQPESLEQEGASVQTGGGYLFVRSSPEGISKVEATLQALQDQLVRNVFVQHTGVLAPVDGSIGNMSPTLQELTMPTLLGRELTVARLLEISIVRDIECQIAQEAAILDPAVDTLQAGTWLRARVAPAGDGMHVQLLVQCTHAPTPASRTVMPGGGVLMPTDIATTLIDHDGVVMSGKTIDHGDGPTITLDGRSFRSSLATTLRW